MTMIPSKVAPCDIATTKPTARTGRSFFSRLLEAMLESDRRQEYREIARYRHLDGRSVHRQCRARYRASHAADLIMLDAGCAAAGPSSVTDAGRAGLHSILPQLPRGWRRAERLLRIPKALAK